jgi:hypothetical protein
MSLLFNNAVDNINWQDADELLIDSGCFYNHYVKKDVVLPVWKLHLTDLYYPHPTFAKQMAFVENKVGFVVHIYDFFEHKKSVNYAKIQRFQGLHDLKCEFEHVLTMSPTFIQKHRHEQFESVTIHADDTPDSGRWFDVEYTYDASANAQREGYNAALGHNIDDVCLCYHNSECSICVISAKKLNERQYIYKRNREGVLRFQIFLIKI